MKFYPLAEAGSGGIGSEEMLLDYKNGHQIGAVRLGAYNIYVKRYLKVYYIAYRNIYRAFRRVKSIPTRVGCCNGDLEIDHRVLNDRERELVEVALPGERAGKAVLSEIHEKAPEVLIGKE